MSKYLHGSEPEEQARLSKLNELLNARCMEQMQINPGNHIIDVGSGLGQLTLAMAARTGAQGKCVGIERDAMQRQTAIKNLSLSGLTNVEFREGYAEQLPLKADEQRSFDIAHARFILEHVADPFLVVKQMAHAVRPGGRIVLIDDDHTLLRLQPEPPEFYKLWDAYMKSYELLGNDPIIGRKLVSILEEVGAIEIRNSVIFFGDCAGSPTFPDYVENIKHILLQCREIVVQADIVTRDVFEAGLREFELWANLPDAAIWYVANRAEGKLPAP